MNTAVNTDSNTGRTAGFGSFMNFGTVAAIIRKDMRTLWPLAAGLMTLTLVLTSLFHDPDDFPYMLLNFGDIQLHVADVLWMSTSTVLTAGTALFIVMLVQQDRAVDPVNDWMYRPIRASEIVMAKVLTVFAVVLTPSFLGNSIYVLIHGDTLGDLVAPIYIAFMSAVFFLVLGWLCSGPFQTLLATLAMAFLLFVLISLSVSIAELNVFMSVQATAIETPLQAPAPPLPPVARPAPVQPGPDMPMIESSTDGLAEGFILLMSQFAIALAGAAIVLWLLLGRRQVLAARLTFLGLFTVTVVAFMTAVEVVDTSTAMPAPSTLEQRIASFAKNDANGDSRLDKAEYQNVLNELGYPDQLDNFWAQRDRDGDAFISLEEIRPEVGLPGPPAPSLEQRMAAFTQYDADHDNKLTKEEYAVALRSLGFGGQVETYWPQRDVNKDGFITLEEYVPAIPQPAAVTQQRR